MNKVTIRHMVTVLKNVAEFYPLTEGEYYTCGGEKAVVRAAADELIVLTNKVEMLEEEIEHRKEAWKEMRDERDRCEDRYYDMYFNSKGV